MEELTDLKKDVGMYMQMDDHQEFWQCLQYLCDYHVTKRNSNSGDTDGVHHAVGDEVKKLFKSKTFQELAALQRQLRV
jgi:predicted MPP superfamily phosphohydrolase